MCELPPRPLLAYRYARAQGIAPGTGDAHGTLHVAATGQPEQLINRRKELPLSGLAARRRARLQQQREEDAAAAVTPELNSASALVASLPVFAPRRRTISVAEELAAELPPNPQAEAPSAAEPSLT